VGLLSNPVEEIGRPAPRPLSGVRA
jgi:hypothetical protein